MFTVQHDPLPSEDDRYRVTIADVTTHTSHSFHCDLEYLGTMEDELRRWRNHRTRVCMVTELTVSPDTGYCSEHANRPWLPRCITTLTNPPGSLAASLTTISAEAQRLGFLTEAHGSGKSATIARLAEEAAQLGAAILPPPYTGWQQPWHEKLHGAACDYPVGRCEALVGTGACCGFAIRCTQMANHSDPTHRAMYDRCDSWPTRGYAETDKPGDPSDLQGLQPPSTVDADKLPSDPLPGLLSPSAPDPGHSGGDNHGG